jgi:thioredoxin-related protein
MRLYLSVFAAVFALITAVTYAPQSVRSWQSPSLQSAKSSVERLLTKDSAQLELVVFERENCHVCQEFRKRNDPRYAAAPTAHEVPLRYVDIDKVDISTLGLKSKLTVLPTIVLMQKGVEVERINGLTAPSTFLVLVKHMRSMVE